MKNSTEKLKVKRQDTDKIRAEGKNPYTELTKERLKTIEEEKQEHKFMFQFIDHQTGKRSEPFVGNWDSVQATLDMVQEGERPYDQDYILLVAILDGPDTKIPATPLITVKSFRQFKADQKSLKEAN